MRRQVAKTKVAILFVLLWQPPLGAQESTSKELNGQVEQVEQHSEQGKYTEALSTAQENLRVAKATFGLEHLNTAQALSNLAKQYFSQSNYSAAEPLYQQALTIREKALGPEHSDVATSLNDLATLYVKQGRYEEAEPLYRRALTIREKSLGTEHPDVATTLNSLGLLYGGEEGKYAQAEPLLNRGLAIREKALGTEHPDVAESLNSVAYIYWGEGKYQEAELLYKRALAIREKTLGPEHPDVAETLNNLASLYWSESKYGEAEPLSKRALAIREKTLGPEHPDVAESLSSLAFLYWLEGKYGEAEPLYKRALPIYEKALGPEHSKVAENLNYLALLYRSEGKYAEAEVLYKRALPIYQKALGLGHPDTALTLNNLATLYQDEGKYADAEPLFRSSLAIREKALGPEHADVANSLNNLALFYRAEGKYAEAKPLLERALAIYEKTLGKEHPYVATTLNNLATVYTDGGEFTRAEPLYDRSIAIQSKVLGPEHPDIANTLNHLAFLYYTQAKYLKAEPLYKRALAIREKTLGSEHPDVASSMSNLAVLYRDEGRYREAQPLFTRALAISEKALGPEHPRTTQILNDLGMLYRNEGKYDEAEAFYARAFENLSNQFQHNFAFMSEKGRLLFLDTVAKAFPTYFSFCLLAKDNRPSLAGRMYDVLLLEKGLVASSVAALRTEIATTGDEKSVTLFEQLAAKRSQLAALLITRTKNPEQWLKTVAELEQETNDTEQELVRRSAPVAEHQKLSSVSWRDVQKALRKDEAAVEFVRFRFHDGKKWTGTSYYAALVVVPQINTTPTLVLLGPATKLEGNPLIAYRETVASRSADGSMRANKRVSATALRKLYLTIWKPLEPALGRAKRVFVSPDGVLNEIALGILPTGSGSLLLEQYDLRTLSSTKDILRAKHVAGTMTAVLFGNPKFTLTETEQREALANLDSPVVPNPGLVTTIQTEARSRELRAGRLLALPKTEKEVESIQSMLKRAGWQTQAYTGGRALKVAIQHVQSPRLLHLATHGFFLPDQESWKNVFQGDLPPGLEEPMLRSGLFLAGADRFLSGAPSVADLDDGVLTAYEAAGLNLQGTELVVLSACDTGLGVLKNGEGVFGLRRALQEAGAESVLMSMWKVPDRETQELMDLFYGNWLAGMDKHEALRQAQLEVRKKVKNRYGYDVPAAWGAFVLVGP